MMPRATLTIADLVRFAAYADSGERLSVTYAIDGGWATMRATVMACYGGGYRNVNGDWVGPWVDFVNIDTGEWTPVALARLVATSVIY